MANLSITKIISDTKRKIYQKLSRIGSTPSIDWPIIVALVIACGIGAVWKGLEIYTNIKNPPGVTGEAGAFGAEAFSQANLKKAIEVIDKKTAVREAARRGYSASYDPSL